MTPQSLAASAAINFGLALVVLSLFSVLKKQPSNAGVYFPRPLSDHLPVSFHPFSFRRLLPSVSWLSRALRVSEDDILLSYGLDTLVVFRLFKFGINFFVVTSLLGLMILIPLNYSSHDGPVAYSKSMNAFTISNVPSGSNLLRFFRTLRVLRATSQTFTTISPLFLQAVGALFLLMACVHLWTIPVIQVRGYLIFIIVNEVGIAIFTIEVNIIANQPCSPCMIVIGRFQLENKEILDRRTQQLCSLRHRADQFTILVHEIPLCTEHAHHGCNVDHFFSKHYPYTYQSYQMLYDEKDINALLNKANGLATKIKHLRKMSLTDESYKRVRRPSLVEALLGDSSSNISERENKLQQICDEIHSSQSETVLQQKELPVAFVTFKSRVGAALAAQARHHLHAFVWITEEAPEPRDVLWKNLSIRSRKLLLYKIGFFVAASLLTLFFALPVAAVQGIAKFEKLKKWFPPAIAIELIPGLQSIVTGYIPSVVLNGFIYVVPFSFLGMAHMAGYFTKSEMEIKVCHMVFYFLVGNVFLLSLLSGSLLDELGESISHPRNIPSHLARAVAAQADFFMTYILTDGLSGFSLEILQAGLLIWNALRNMRSNIRSYIYGRGEELSPLLFSLPYFRVIPYTSLSILIGMVYAIVAPLLLPFLVGYLYLGYAVYINQIEDVYCTSYETCGQYWPYIHHYILFAIVFMQITMMGLFGLKRKPEASIATIPLLVLTLLFNEYCKLRFLPSFQHNPIQNAKEKDDLDEREGKLKHNSENATKEYRPPYLRPISFLRAEASSSQQLPVR